MSRQGERRRRGAAFLLGSILWLASAAGVQPTAQAADLKADVLIPVGHTIGIKLFSEGVVVVGLAEVETEKGRVTPGADCGLRVGDVIEEVNGREVSSSEEFASSIQCGGTVRLGVSRQGEELTLAAEPVRGEDGAYRLGAWVRDSIAGIGTVTFYDPATGAFGALGHGVTDSDTGLLMPLGDGAVMGSTVKAVKRGAPGAPGELRGDFDLTHDMGTLHANTERGVFGTLDGGGFAGKAVPVAASAEIRPGPAVILSNVEGDRVEAYDIEIVRVLRQQDTRDLLIQVTDDRLIQKTGGIVQGMSGSPIMQNGKLVGAVTHVMVNDPTRGYGIFIENMLTAAK